MKQIFSIISDSEKLLALEPEELAGVVLECLNSATREDGDSILNRVNFINYNTVKDYPQPYHERIMCALMEAWVWLEREGLIAPRPRETSGTWVFVTRRGQRLKDRTDFAAYRGADILPKGLLHPVIAQEVWSTFIRGKYDVAAFQAFKEVEVAVRTAGRFVAADLGVKLMRKALDPQNGPLTDKTSPEAERQALSDLFAGAMGSYKNPGSHRHLSIDAPEAVEMIMLASHLLKIVESRTVATPAPPNPSR